jgi:hypothetical protein
MFIHETALWQCGQTGLRISLGGLTMLKHLQDVQRIGAFTVVDPSVLSHAKVYNTIGVSYTARHVDEQRSTVGNA